MRELTPQERREREPLYEQILDFYYKWHRLEQENGVDIIDLDLVGRTDDFPGSFSSREEAIDKLSQVLESYREVSSPGDFVEAKLEASLYFLRALMGEQIPFPKYVEKTMGVIPAYIPEEELSAQLERTRGAFEALGYRYEKEDLERYNEDNRLGEREVEADFNRARDKFLPVLQEWLGLEFPLTYSTRFVNEDAYWSSWISTDLEGNILIRYNLNERTVWTRAKIQNFALHEVGAHALQALSWRARIREGKVPAPAGILSVFTPEQFSLEGIAQSLPLFCPEIQLSEEGRYGYESYKLFMLSHANLHVMANQGVSPEEVIAFIHRYLPHLKEEDLRKEIDERVNHPLYRTYTYIYGPSLYHHSRIAQRLTVDGRRGFVLDAYQNVRTPSQILGRYDTLHASK